MKLLQELNIVDCSKRKGQTDEYSFTPTEEWQQYVPPIPDKDDRTSQIVEFPVIQTAITVTTEPIPIEDDLVEDTNNVDRFSEQQQEVRTFHKHIPSIWRSNPDGTRYAQVPLIYDQAVGVEIQRQIDCEGLSAQAVVGRAIAFSKIPLLLLEMFSNLGQKLLDGCKKVVYTEQSHKTSEGKNQSELDEFLVSLPLQKTLCSIGVNLVSEQLQKCVLEYGEEVMLNAAVRLKKTGAIALQDNPTDYFLGFLQNGLGL